MRSGEKVVVTVDRARLLSTLAWLGGIVDTSIPVPILGTVRLSFGNRALLIEGTDLDAGGRMSLPVDGAGDKAHAMKAICVPHKDFLRVVRNVPGSTVAMTIGADEIRVTSGDKGQKSRYRATLQCPPGESYPEIPWDEEPNPNHAYIIPYRALADALGAVTPCVSEANDSARYSLKGALVRVGEAHAMAPITDRRGVLAVATDGHRMLICSRKWTQEEGREPEDDLVMGASLALYPKSFIRALGSVPGPHGGPSGSPTTPLRVSVSQNHVRAIMGGEGGEEGEGEGAPAWVVIARRVTGSFPDYARILQDNHPERKWHKEGPEPPMVRFRGAVADWIESADRVRGMAEEGKRVQVHLEPWGLGAVTGEDSDQGAGGAGGAGDGPGSWIEGARSTVGTVRDGLSCTITDGLGTGDSLELAINVDYLKEALVLMRALGAEEFQGWVRYGAKGDSGAVNLLAAGLWAIIMPMR